MEKENKIVDEFVKMSKEEAERELKGYKITIEDLKTGEKQEHTSDCILAVFNNKGDKSATQLAITQCQPYITLQCMKALKKLEMSLLIEMVKDFGKIINEEDGDDEE